MISFSHRVIGGPADGEVWSQPFPPPHGGERVERSPFDSFNGPHSVYRFDADVGAWLFVAVLRRDEYSARVRAIADGTMRRTIDDCGDAAA